MSFNNGNLSAASGRLLDVRIGKKHPIRWGTQTYEFTAGRGTIENPWMEVEHSNQVDMESLYKLKIPDITAFLTQPDTFSLQSISIHVNLYLLNRKKMREIQFGVGDWGNKDKRPKVSLNRVWLK